MKYVFTVQTSDDGLMPCVFTNIKALFTYLITDNDGFHFHPQTIFVDRKDIPFTYANLVKTIRDAQKANKLHVARIDCKFDNSISISDLLVKSK